MNTKNVDDTINRHTKMTSYMPPEVSVNLRHNRSYPEEQTAQATCSGCCAWCSRRAAWVVGRQGHCPVHLMGVAASRTRGQTAGS